MPDEGAPSPLAEQLAARPLPRPIVTLPTYTTADALALFARLLEAIGYHATHSALLQEAGDRREALTQRAASLSEIELQQHLALCLPGVATTVANAKAAGPPNGCTAVVAAGAADSALPAAVPLRVSTQPQPPQPRKAALPAPGSAGAMSRKQANAFFTAARPREPTPAGADIAADATDTGADAGPAPAAAPTPDAAAAAGSPQQPCTAPLDFLLVAGPSGEDTDLATDGDGDGAAPPPPPLHSPPVDAAAHDASSPAVSPLPMAAPPPPPPPCDLEKAGADSAAQPAGSVPSRPADSASQQGAGDFAEAAVEAIAQRLDMGGCASPTAGDVSQDEVAYTPSAMDADEPFSHSKAATPRSFRRASGPRRASGSKGDAQGDTLFDILNDDDGDDAEDDGSQWKASPPPALHRSKLGVGSRHVADAAHAGDRQRGASSSRSRSRDSPCNDQAHRQADKAGRSPQPRSRSPTGRRRDSRGAERDRRQERRSRHGSQKRPAELHPEELRRQAAKRVAGSSPGLRKADRHEHAHRQRPSEEVQPGTRRPDERQHSAAQPDSRQRRDRQSDARQAEGGSRREQEHRHRPDRHARTDCHQRSERERGTPRHSSRRGSLRSPVAVDAEALRVIAAQRLAEKLPPSAEATPSRVPPAHGTPPRGQAEQQLHTDGGRQASQVPPMQSLVDWSPPGLGTPDPVHSAAAHVAAIGRYQQHELPLLPPPPRAAPQQQSQEPLGSQISSVLQRLLGSSTGASGSQVQPSPDDIDVLHDDWMLAAAEKKQRAQLREAAHQQLAERAQSGAMPPPPPGLPPPPPLHPPQAMRATTHDRRLQDGRRSADSREHSGEAASGRGRSPERHHGSRWGPEAGRSGDAGRDRHRDSSRRQSAQAEQPTYVDTGAEAAAQLKKLARGGSQAHGIGAQPRPSLHRLSSASSPSKHGAEPPSSLRSRRSIQADDRHEVARAAAVALLAWKPEPRIPGRGASPAEARPPPQDAPSAAAGAQQPVRSTDGVADTLPSAADADPAAAAPYVGQGPSPAAGIWPASGSAAPTVPPAQMLQQASGPDALPPGLQQDNIVEQGRQQAQQQQQQQQQQAAVPPPLEQQDRQALQPAQEQPAAADPPPPEAGITQQPIASQAELLPQHHAQQQPAQRTLRQPAAHPQHPPRELLDEQQAQVQQPPTNQVQQPQQPQNASQLPQHEAQQAKPPEQQQQQQQQQQQAGVLRKRKEPVVFQPSPKTPGPVAVEASSPAKAPAAQRQPAAREGAPGKKAAAGKKAAGNAKGRAAMAGRKRGPESASEPDAPASAGDTAAPRRQSAMKRLKQANASPAANGSSKQAAGAGAAGTTQPPARQSALDRLETGPAAAAPGKGGGRRAAATAQQRQTGSPTKAAATAATQDRSGGQQLQRKGKQPIVFMAKGGK